MRSAVERRGALEAAHREIRHQHDVRDPVDGRVDAADLPGAVHVVYAFRVRLAKLRRTQRRLRACVGDRTAMARGRDVLALGSGRRGARGVVSNAAADLAARTIARLKALELGLLARTGLALRDAGPRLVEGDAARVRREIASHAAAQRNASFVEYDVRLHASARRTGGGATARTRATGMRPARRAGTAAAARPRRAGTASGAGPARARRIVRIVPRHGAVAFA